MKKLYVEEENEKIGGFSGVMLDGLFVFYDYAKLITNIYNFWG